MKKTNTLKRVAALVLALVMVFSMVPAMPSKAASTRSVTLYVGEAIYYTNYNKVRSTKSSKKSVASVSKDSSNNTHANIRAKKAGKATLTIRTTAGTQKIKVTVKKLNVTASLKDLGNGYVMITVKNHTKQIFESLTVGYALTDTSGNIVLKDTVNVYNVLPGKTSYTKVYYNQRAYSLNINTSAAVVGHSTYGSRSINYKYTNRSSKVKASVTDRTSDSSSISFNVTTKNKTSASVSGSNYILLYDASNNVIGVENRSFYLRSHATDTTKITIYTSTYKNYDHYKILTRAYSKKYKGF
ncbi:MAG: hypothetical protein K6A30_06800 [Lachnospiraceae bacterium]|nr:hypothetical protein [Lachnospiraceae bacterium]